MQFLDGVIGVREAVLAALHGTVTILPGQFLKSAQDAVHLLRADTIQTVRVGGCRREPYRAESDFLRQMLINPPHMRYTGAERYTSPDGVGPVALQEHLYFRDDDVVTSSPVMKHSHLVVEFAVSIDANRDADPVF